LRFESFRSSSQNRGDVAKEKARKLGFAGFFRIPRLLKLVDSCAAFVKDVRTFLEEGTSNTQQLIAAIETLTTKEYESSDPGSGFSYKPISSPDAWNGPTILY